MAIQDQRRNLDRVYPDTHEDIVWQTIDPNDIWLLDKLILSRKLGYTCGPVGLDVPKPDWYIVRPCVNALGLCLGAEKVWLDESTMHLPLGYFWCEWFQGNHYSIDFMPEWGVKTLTVQGFKSKDTFIKWDKWIKVDHQKQHEIPKILYPTILKYQTINLEYIDDKLIEVHFRSNPDFPGARNEYVPVWEGQDTNAPLGYTYIKDPDVHGRIGAFVK